MENPFSLSFGKNPNLVINRPNEKSEIIDAFSSNEINQQIYAITAIRGSGKTVLMTEIADYFRQETDWIVLELNPNKDLLESCLSKIYASAGPTLKSLNLNLTFFNIITVGAALEDRITDYETALIGVLEHLKKKGKRVLLTIDEVTNNEYMKVFAGSFQIFIRRNLPVFLLVTGLYQNVRNLQDEKSLTFLYRTPRITLGPLSLSAIAMKYKTVFHLSDVQAREMAGYTKGYAFAFQALGHLTYRNDGKYADILEDYQLMLEEYSYEKIWSELSPIDRKICFQAALSEDRSVSAIMKASGMDANHFNPYRKRLLDKGVMSGAERGTLAFSLPFFDAFVLNNYFE